MTAVAIIVAAGQGKRMKTRMPKVFLPLAGKPILAHTLKPFEQSSVIREIIVVVPAGYAVRCWKEIVEKYGFRKVSAVIHGGKERQDSVAAALKLVTPQTELVAIHDGARPLVQARTIQLSLEAAQRIGAAVVAVRVKDTIKQVSGTTIRATLDRNELWAMQTPQVFRYPLILKAYQQIPQRAVAATDDASLVEKLGHAVTVVEGDYENIKVTTPDDLVVAATLLHRRK
jgi:2-C-methyl-D-erythritol 4-phosphate cytidylyltransferase